MKLYTGYSNTKSASNPNHSVTTNTLVLPNNHATMLDIDNAR